MTAKWSRWRYLEARFVTILTIRFKGALVPAWPADRSPTRTGPVEADGAVDAQNAPTAPWKTLLVFHELPQGFPHPITHDKPRKSPESYWETRIDPEKHARGRKRRPGLYPALVVRGIYDRCTPKLASDASRAVAMLSSLAEAQAQLRDDGIALDIKTLRATAYRYAARARAAQQCAACGLLDRVTGKRVVVSLDGGRVRVRRKKRGPKTKKGRNRFHTDWKEPKLLILYVVGDDGRPAQTWAPIIDGTLRGPDAVFALLQSYARQIGLTAADKVLFIADGAPWIWQRITRLIAALGLSPTQVLGLIDFYHAAKQLSDAVKLRRWTATRRTRWLTRTRGLLKRARVDEVIAALRALCRGRTAGKIRTHLNYFVKNRHRFAYTTMAGLGLPRGSGAIESAIRRVINLRIKGASIYWLPESVEAILLLRSFYKSGRWNCLQRMAMTPVGVSA